MFPRSVVREVTTSPLFEPDAVLPAQWAALWTAAELRPEARLRLAVIEDAIGVLAKYGPLTDPKALALVDDARNWIRDYRGRGSSYRVTFEEAVDALPGHLDAEALSLGILRQFDRQRTTRFRAQRQAHAVRPADHYIHAVG